VFFIRLIQLVTYIYVNALRDRH